MMPDHITSDEVVLGIAVGSGILAIGFLIWLASILKERKRDGWDWDF